LHINYLEVKASNGYPVYNLNTGLNYTTIQGAINAPETLNGHTIFVEKGTYYEHILVNKSISLIGQNRSTTILDGSGNGTVVTISKDDVNVIDFTVQNSGGPPERGLYLDNVNNCSIIGNRIIDNQFGIRIWNSSNNNTISENNITSNQAGIYLYGSSNIISGNNVFDNYYGISLYVSSSDNIISGNNLENRGYGTSFYSDSSNNTISYNNITRHFGGIYLDRSSNNSFYHNNIIDNNDQVILDEFSNNAWDNGIEGNYWSDYSGVDMDGGGDGLGDSPYLIAMDNTDSHPLMGPVTFFDAGTWDEKAYYVHTVSNSTTSDFNFHMTSHLVTFNVTGLDGTIGFCRVAIPRELLWCSDIFDWTVIVNGTMAIPLRIQEHAEDTYLYFTYSHSVQIVEVYGTQAIPEFPSILVLPLFMFITLLIVRIDKRKRKV
jgi:parallel beta-helix repeat protein